MLRTADMPSFFLLFLETDVLYCVIAPRELYRDIKQETSSACPALFFCEERICVIPLPDVTIA